MTISTLFQILGSLFIFVGYWLNAKNHARQHMLFIFGHVFLISFSVVEAKWVLAALSLFVIFMQLKATKKKYKFKKDIVRIKNAAKKVKSKEYQIGIRNKRNEDKGLHKENAAVVGNRHKKSHILQSGEKQVREQVIQ